MLKIARIFGAGLALVLCAVAAMVQRTTVADVPMLSRGSEPAVEIKINGEGPFIFAIDTGGGLQADLDPMLVARLSLPVSGKVRGGDPSGQNARDFDTVLVDSISFGGAEFRNVTAMVRQQQLAPGAFHIDGILGFALFTDYLLTLDYPGKRVQLERGELPKANGADILNFELQRRIPVVELGVGKLKLRAHIDSGNMMGGFVLPAAIVLKLDLASEPKVVGRARTISNEIEIKQVQLNDLIKLGSFEFSKPTVTFPTIAEDANIGSRVLNEFAITFDQKNLRLQLKRSAPRVEAAPAAAASSSNEFSGRYGSRSIFKLGSDLYLQRDGGPKLKLIAAGKDEFKLAEVPEARIKFVRDAAGKITELQVRNREGEWEGAPKE